MLVIFHFQPGPVFTIELMEILHLIVFEFAKEVAAHGFVKAFDFAFSLRAVRSAGNFADTQFGADRIDLMGGIDLPVIHIKDFRDTIF